MALYPSYKAPSMKGSVSVALSTSTDGVTGSDIVDSGGLALAGIDLATSVSTACTYSFKGSPDSTSALHTVYTSTGGLLTYGSTLVDPRGTYLAFDPAPFSGIRFIQLVSLTTSAAAPNATGATAKLCFSAPGEIK